jgi:TrmH family RNA methyltransferase
MILTDRRATTVASQAATSSAALARVRIVLVATTHPGNIGAAARAMKTMGLGALALVTPLRFPSAEATARAAGADDILAAAGVHDTLEEAVAGCRIVYGTTARERRIAWPTETVRDAAALIAACADPVAVVFGRERSGLTNAELDCCQRAIHIPTSADYRSLNLAQAVQICAYEIRLAHDASMAPSRSARRARLDADASADELDALRAHCLRVMEAVDYYNPQAPKLLERRLKRLLSRADLKHSETQFLRGFLTAIEARIGKA